MLGSDKWIRQQCVHPSRLQAKDFNGMCPHEMHTSLIKGHENITPMITPFHPQLVREVNNAKVLSFGTSSFGYDIQLKPEWKTPKPGIRLDPKKDAARAHRIYASHLARAKWMAEHGHSGLMRIGLH